MNLHFCSVSQIKVKSRVSSSTSESCTSTMIIHNTQTCVYIIPYTYITHKILTRKNCNSHSINLSLITHQNQNATTPRKKSPRFNPSHPVSPNARLSTKYAHTAKMQKSKRQQFHTLQSAQTRTTKSLDDCGALGRSSATARTSKVSLKINHAWVKKRESARSATRYSRVYILRFSAAVVCSIALHVFSRGAFPKACACSSIRGPEIVDNCPRMRVLCV